MSPDRARNIANALLISVAGVAAYLILSRPTVRRAIWNLSRPYLATLPDALLREIAHAWVHSGQPS